jgi:hypothetical protein
MVFLPPLLRNLLIELLYSAPYSSISIWPLGNVDILAPFTLKIQFFSLHCLFYSLCYHTVNSFHHSQYFLVENRSPLNSKVLDEYTSGNMTSLVVGSGVEYEEIDYGDDGM